MKDALLSVIITTYNREIDILDRAVISVKEQTYQNIEIIVVDDNPESSMLPLQIYNYCKKNNVIYLKQFGNMGACAARNLGVSNSKGSIIAFLDDDDTWMPTKASEQIPYIVKGYGLVFCKGLKISTQNHFYKEEIYGNSIDFIQQPTFEDMLIKNRVGTTSQIMVSRDCFYSINGFDPAFLARQDYDFCLRASQKYKLYGVDCVLFKHYLHSEQQISQNVDKTLQGYKLLYQKYKKFYAHNKLAYINICCKISKTHLHKKEYSKWIFMMIKAFVKYPLKSKYIINKSCQKSII